MAAPKKTGLDYFNIDINQEDNLSFVEAKHGLQGYAIVIKLWAKIYKHEGYFCPWKERNAYIFARDINVDIEVIKSVVETCLEEEIFSRDKLDNYSILTSSGIQKRYKKIVTDAKRKNCEINPLYLVTKKSATETDQEDTLDELTQSLPGLTPEKQVLTPEIIPQSKVKYSIVEDSKLKDNTPPGSPAGDPGDGSVSIDKKNTIDYWQHLVNTWFNFYKSKHNGDEPNFKGRNPAFFKQLVELLRDRSRKKGILWVESTACNSLSFFLDIAISDKWLADHFLLENLVKQFDAIYAREKGRQAEKQKHKAAISSPSDDFKKTVSYLIERFVEPDFDARVILPEYYDKLVTGNFIASGSLGAFPGPSIDEKKIQAVTAYLKACTNPKK